MRYFGSKGSTTERVYEIISQRILSGTFCDPFGGIATVGSYFKTKGYAVWSGDILAFAHCFQIARLEVDNTPSFESLCRSLNLKSSNEVIALLKGEPPKRDWIVEEYAKQRHFFTEENGALIDACRLRINEWSRNGWLNKSERAVLIASLINCMDKVANTAGTYYAYLKTWHRKALLPFCFELIPHAVGNAKCYCFYEDAEKVVGKKSYDIIYLDPPYNERSYVQYYHLPETLALEGTPRIHGKSGMPDEDRPVSDFNRPQNAQRALERLLRKASFKLLAFHYSDDGLIKPHVVRNVLSQYGKVEDFTLNSIGYTTSKTARTEEHHLYVVTHG